MTESYKLIPHDERNWRIDMDYIGEDKKSKQPVPLTKTIGFYPGLQSAAKGLFDHVAKAESGAQIATYGDMVNVVDKALARVEAIARQIASGTPDLEPVAQIVDRLDNLNGALQIPLTADMHLDSMKSVLPDLRDELKAAVIAAGHDDVWS